MSKHDVIVKNLTTLTHTRTFESAVKGWTVKQNVSLPSRQTQACELCGTRFGNGARIQHLKTSAVVLVGGTCLHTILKSRFPPRFNFSEQRQITLTTLRSAYSNIIDPGNWTKWIVENAPQRLAPSIADLRIFGTLQTEKELDALIRFHDQKRLFRREALFSDPKLWASHHRIEIPTYLTIEQARKIQRGPASQVPARTLDYATRVVRPYVKRDRKLSALWKSLIPLEQRALTALAALDERAAPMNASLCSSDLTVSWPPPGKAPMFVWNAKIGLGFVSAKDILDANKAYVWVWRSAEYKKCIYSLERWRGIVGCSEDVVLTMERIAFASGQP